MLTGLESMLQRKRDFIRNVFSLRDHLARFRGGIRLSCEDFKGPDIIHSGGSAETEFDAFEQSRSLAALDDHAEAEDRIEILADERGAHRLRGLHGNRLRRARTVDFHVVDQNARFRRGGDSEADFARAFRQSKPDLRVESADLHLLVRLMNFAPFAGGLGIDAELERIALRPALCL